MKKTIFSIALALAALVGFTACEKEINTGKDVIEGLPVNSIKLNLSAPSDDVIAVTRASAEVETNVQNMALLFYKAGTDDKPIIVYVDKNGMGTPTQIVAEGKTESTNYKYTVNLDVTDKGITTGNWYLYAIANYNTKFCNIDMDKISGLTRTEFLDHKVNKANRELDIVENAVLMTGNYCENGKFGEDGALTLAYDNKEEETCVMNGVIHLRRIVAKISFEFKNGENQTTTGVTFTPETYSIHEYSRSSTLMERPYDGWTTTNGVTYNNGEYAGTGDFHSHADGVALAVVNNKVEFYMPENIQKAKASPEKWTYSERERRESATDRTFKYAPEHGTYIVVKGQYKDSKYSGDVTYTIHLGDFSATNGNAYENFSIRRNYHYTYTVTVNGVNNIVVEAQTDEENQSGAEGNLIGYNSESFNIRLDAHYENVLLKIAAPTGSTINEYSVMLNTPYSENVLITSNDLTGKASADYDWIRFGQPASATAFKAYNESETTDIFTFLDELKGSSLTTDGEHYIVRDGYIYTTAYVNEYYYDSKMNSASDKSAELKKFINADDRTMTIAFGTIEVSSDKQSSYTDNVVFSIQQRSIKSFFDLTVNNPFGVEQVDETPATKSYNYASSGSTNSSYNDNHYGYNNFKNAVGTSASWNTYVNSDSFGYTLSDNSISFNSNALTTTGAYGLYQCLSRNRDENGDGTIDGDEIKWYLPAVDQCTNYWFGMNSLPVDARIKMATNTGSVNNYFTSTSGKSAWWADEGSSYGGYYGSNNSSVRCVRSLKNYSDETTDLSSFNSDNQTISIIGLDSKSVRESFTVETEYSEHFRGESQDKLPQAFKVAQSDFDKEVETLITPTVTATQSGFGSYYYSISNILDGNTSTYWRSSASQTTGYYVLLTYSAPVNLSKINITFGSSYYPRNMTLQISEDNTTWVNVDNIDINKTSVAGSFTSEQAQKEVKYVRLYVTGSYSTYLQIYDISIECEPVNKEYTTAARSTFTKSEVMTGNWCQKYYYESEDKSDLGKWRIPNEKELTLMLKYTDQLTNALSTDYTCAKSKYERPNSEGTMVYYVNARNVITTDKNDNTGSTAIGDRQIFTIRCVRDTTPDTSGADETDKSSNTFESGGNVIK